MKREQLGKLRSLDLTDTLLKVEYEGEVKRYTLSKRLGDGKTAIAWLAEDRRGQKWVIKFSQISEYTSHSLASEISRVNELETILVAKIDFFGNPIDESGEFKLDGFYAIVVEWIEGVTLKKYLADSNQAMSVDSFCQMARDFCEILKCFNAAKLSHSDLHDENVMVRVQTDPLTGAKSTRLVAIDTGQIKTWERRSDLLDQWQKKLDVLESLEPECSSAKEALTARTWIEYFGRSDHEWVICHLCEMYNKLLRGDGDSAIHHSFFEAVPKILTKALDPDPSARLTDPLYLFSEIEGKKSSLLDSDETNMQSPFDLPSAELIRSDRQLMRLFSNEYPRLDECRSNSPVYIYGPRGCGKSTLLRSMSLAAILKSGNPDTLLSEVEFLGVYLSCSTEFRSRFWLFKEEDFEILEAHVVQYFSLLLCEGLCEMYDSILEWDQQSHTKQFGLTHSLANECVKVFLRRLNIDQVAPYHSTSPFTQLRLQIRRERDHLWKQILDRATSPERTNSQLIFDIVADLEKICPFLKSKRIAFLIDDYSNQRIPESLQKRLNQSITFAKQSNPIFKVSSEYFGVDLEGIHEGREVREINVGSEYVGRHGEKRWSFLQEVLDRRFDYKGVKTSALTILPPSGTTPAHDMARKICDAVANKKQFHYHGIDTISDLCSGDFATGLDIVRRMFETSGISWEHPTAIPNNIQHKVISEYSGREHEYIRFRTVDGQIKFEIVNSLCNLSKQCVIGKTRKKGGKDMPLVKNHLDISEVAITQLERHSPKLHQLLMDLVRKGMLFPLDTSRSRELHQGTRRYMVRRILLARFGTALGRDTPIKIDGLEKLRQLLTEPSKFAEEELGKTGSRPPSKNSSLDSQAFLFDNEE